MIDLTPYIAKGFPGDLDEKIANVGVAGIDREQAHNMVRLCPETEAVLYGSEYSPTNIRYRRGSRPELEKIASQLAGETDRERALAAMDWVYRNVGHPYIVGHMRPDRAYTEEQLIDSKCGWCNEQARVFIGLCQVMEIPARLCFINHVNALCGHTTAEAYVDGRWAFFDPTFNVSVELPDGHLAEARQLSGTYREFAHAAYREPLQKTYAQIQPFVEEEPGWCESDRPKVDRGGDLLNTIGICNYLIEGVEVIPGGNG